MLLQICQLCNVGRAISVQRTRVISLNFENVALQIDRVTGVVTTAQLLDIPSVGVHTLSVVANDAGLPTRNSTCK